MDNKIHAIPTPATHPILSKKINTLFNILTEKSREQKTLSKSVTVPQPTEPIPSASSSSIVPAGETNKRPLILDRNVKINTTYTSNIPITNLTADDLKRIFVPIPCTGEHRWLMVTLKQDFSHIWFPSWKKFLSLKRIRSALAYAEKTDKTVQISPANVKPDVYCASKQPNKIFVGPYEVNGQMDLALFVRYENKMMLLKNYEILTGNIDPNKTTGNKNT